MPVDEASDVLSVEDAARVLHISRGKAYEQARLYLRTNGSEGLPVIAFGRAFRVPRAELERMLGGKLRSRAVTPAVDEGDDEPAEPAAGPSMPDADPSETSRGPDQAPAPAESVGMARNGSPRRSRRARSKPNDAQLSLFDVDPKPPNDSSR